MSSTVSTNKDKVRAGLKLSESVGLEGPYVVTKALPQWDHCGYEVAIQMVLASLKPGKYSDVYTQWDTVRKYRTASSNQFRASSQAASQEVSLCDDKGHTQRLSSDPCASVWFGRFFLHGLQTKNGTRLATQQGNGHQIDSRAFKQSSSQDR